MGGGGGGGFRWPKPDSVRKQAQQAAQRAEESAFGTELGDHIGSLLTSLNSRDTALLQSRMAQVTKAIEKDVAGTVATQYGGSVAKHTYVDGLSDIDCLLILNDTDLADSSPKQCLRHLGKLLKDRLGRSATIEVGQLAVTLKFEDRMELQCLPAIRTAEGVRIPSASHRQSWSDIDPEKFQAALTRHNQSCGGKLVPTIKLAKSIISNLPESSQLSGYHIEALAIAAFRGYRGDFVPARMLSHFFDRASSLVLSPIKDSTGQSVHVDDYLGEEGSHSRASIGQAFDRISKRMRNATAMEDIETWKEILGQ